MNVTLGDYTITAGTPKGEPCRLVSGKGSRNVAVRNFIDSDDPDIHDLKNAVVEDSLEAEYQYAAPVDAFLGFTERRDKLLSLPKGTLSYNGKTVAHNAVVKEVSLTDWTGVGITVRVDVIGTRPPK